MTTNDLQSYVNGISAVAQTDPGSVASIEEFNEINNWPINYNGMVQGLGRWDDRGPPGDYSSPAAAARDLYGMLKADPRLSGLPVNDLSAGNYGGNSAEVGLLNTAGHADVPNIHAYPVPGMTTQSYVDYEMSFEYRGLPASTPHVVTEFGYSRYRVEPSTVPYTETGKANGILNSYLSLFKHGSVASYAYELVDNGDIPGFGLFRSDQTTPRISAIDVHNLTTILGDKGPPTSAPGSVDFTLSGMPAAAGRILLEKSDGKTFDLTLWNEGSPGGRVSVDLGSMCNSVKIYDPTVGTTPVQKLGYSRYASVDLTDHPVIIQFVHT
jgi:hypothetical protein